ncbi:MAG: sialidase family protein [Hyphomicrobiaceae bacterium]
MSTPEKIAAGMDGGLREVEPGRLEALLPSPCIQNHAAFLTLEPYGLSCHWFGGSLEGNSDISIYTSKLTDTAWSPGCRMTDDPECSEQNPVKFNSPDGRQLVLNTAQPGGNQDECVIRVREQGCAPNDLALPRGTFIRGPVHVRGDGAWLLPLFRCVARAGQRWTGSHDKAVSAISGDGGVTWREVEVPRSIGCVHMTLVELQDGRLAAYFRRRQADFVHRSESSDGGESWSVPVALDVPNNNSSISAIRLRDGRVALACNPVNAVMHPESRRASLYDELGAGDDRPNATGGCNPVWGVPRAPMVLCLSEDGGYRFQKQIVIENGMGSCLSNNSIDGGNQEMSYPSLVEDDRLTLHLAYTYHRRAIKYVQLKSEWLQLREAG